MPRRRLGGISSRSSHSLNSGYVAALAAESVEAKPEPEAKPPAEGVIGLSSVDDIDVDKYVKKRSDMSNNDSRIYLSLV
jgi:hypothetical protein